MRRLFAIAALAVTIAAGTPVAVAALSARSSCTDGKLRCDFDGTADGKCTFIVRPLGFPPFPVSVIVKEGRRSTRFVLEPNGNRISLRCRRSNTTTTTTTTSPSTTSTTTAVLPSCGPVCLDGTPAVWTGTAAPADGGSVNIEFTMCPRLSTGTIVDWRCTAGTAPCAVAGGQLFASFSNGTNGSFLNAETEEEPPFKFYCFFLGRGTPTSMQGRYACADCRSLVVCRPVHHATWQIARCP